ncbi:MAG: methionyl-tRNA formyltransferase [Clostridia bacterium]|nr:methionyl-tRNA formyltransferase [Clostridia bacterium]
MNIVFMGTPDFSVPCLQRLIDDGHTVSAVFTQPDKPKGRGHHMMPPPVKELAVKYNIPVYQPQKLRTSDAFEILTEINPELIIVVAYGQILPKNILDLPKYGCVNIHASLLPKYRGAAPIQWSVLNGEKKSGVTSMQMDVGLDTGDMLLTAETEIGENDTAEDLHDKLSVMGAEVMSETIDLIMKGQLNPIKQDDSLSTYAHMLSKDLSPIDWNESAQCVHNKVRGLYSWPCATAELDGKIIKIHKTALAGKVNGTAGQVVESGKKLVVACGDGNGVEIITLQAQGKKAMNSADYLRGNPVEKGIILK